MKGIFRKYHADADNDLRDNVDECGCSELSDPDFWSNRFPIWSICGPYVRNKLEVNDVIFFIPTKESLDKLELKEPICTGVLYVSEIIGDFNQLEKKEGISKEYFKKYKEDLYNHINKDRNRTKKIRGKNIIIGDKEKSKWLGKKFFKIKPLIESLDRELYDQICLNRIIKYLKDENTKKIYEEIISSQPELLQMRHEGQICFEH